MIISRHFALFFAAFACVAFHLRSASFRMTVFALIAAVLATVAQAAPLAPQIVIEQPLGTPRVVGGVPVAWGNQATSLPAGLKDVQAISAGVEHAVVLKIDGSVIAFGTNSAGQTTVPAGLAGVQAIAAGGYHSVALKSDGTVVAWGRSSEGQTIAPAGLTDVVAIAAGDFHTVALKSDGTVVAWGYGAQGQTTVPAGLTGVQSIAANGLHTVALKSDGTVVAWGYNNLGQINVPAGLTGVQAISAGEEFTLALKSNGTVVAWGSNVVGQTNVPAGLAGGVRAIAAGAKHALALKNDGSVAAWGYNIYGQANVPAGLLGVQAIAAGGGQSLALVGQTPAVAFGTKSLGGGSVEKIFTIKNAGSAALNIVSTSIIGANAADFTLNTAGMLATIPASGQTAFSVTFQPGALGNRTALLRILSNSNVTPIYDILLTGDSNVIKSSLSIEQPVSVLQASDSSVIGWGSNAIGQMNFPSSLTGVRSIAAGYYHTLVLKDSGNVFAWGINDFGEAKVPAALSDVRAVAGGINHSVALKNDGTVSAWGRNFEGQTKVPLGLSNVQAITAGNYHTVALKVDGTVIAWGYNNSGQTDVPSGLTNVRSIAAGGFHTVALKNDGTVAAWGYNSYGQINVPAGLTGVQAISAGEEFTLALKNDGTVVAWGKNVEGQTNVPAGLAGVQAIAGGKTHAAALKRDGTVVAWGNNSSGQTTVPAGLPRVLAIAAGADHTVALANKAPTVAFGSQKMAGSSAAKTFVIRNTGIDALSITGVAVTGGNSGDFSVDTTGMSGSVPATGQTTFNVRFMPGALGSRSTTLRILSSDIATPVYDITLTGRGLAASPAITIEQPLGASLVDGSLVFDWSANESGQNNAPAGLTDVIAISESSAHRVALKKDGTVVAWGNNTYGQTNVPAGLTGVLAIAAGSKHTLAVKADGTVIGFGDNSKGQTSVPAGLTGVQAVAAGGEFSMALKNDGTVVAWGSNSSGQTNVPVGLMKALAIAAGLENGVALTKDGYVTVWGSNIYGQNNVPSGLMEVRSIATGSDRVLALKEDGTVVAWGYNFRGESSVPAGLTDVKAIAAGLGHNVALKEDGTIVLFGNLSFKQFTAPAGLVGTQAIAAAGDSILAIGRGTPAVAFGSQEAGIFNNAAKSFIIRNTGTSALNITSATVTGGNTGDFIVDTTGMLTSIPAGGQTAVNVAFRPSAPGNRTTTLRVLNNDSTRPVYDIALSGIGIDTTAPVITQHQDVIAEATGAAGAPVAYAAANATDNSGAAPVITYSKNSGSIFPFGVTAVSITATDANNNASSSSFTVTVRDSTAPFIAAHGNVAAEASNAAGATVSYAAATASDAVTANPSIAYSQASGTLFPIGVTTVTVTATDAANNAGTRTFTVTVSDTTAPIIAAHASVIVEASSAAGAVVDYAAASASDAVTPNPAITYSKASGTVFPLGATPVIITATDEANNKKTQTFTVTVRDTTAPVVAAHANVTAEATSAAGAAVSYAAAIASDAVTTNPAISYSKASGTTFPIGVTTVTATATDAAGNAGVGTFTVTVSDTTAPVIAAHPNVTVEAASAAGATVSYAPASANDAVTKNPGITYSQASGTVFPIGVTTVTMTSTDSAGNVATKTFTVTVSDTTPPVIAAHPNVTVEATSASGSVVNYTAANAGDAVDPAPVLVSVPASGSLFPIGATTVNVTATDSAGNHSSASFTVTVNDTAAPVLSLPANIVVGAAGASGSVVTFTPTAVDAADPAPVVVSVPASGSTFPIGTTTVQVTATDNTGHSSSGSFTVTVRDLVAPGLILINPKDGQKITSNEVLFSGRATDDRSIARVEVVLNGGAPQIARPAGMTEDFVWTLSVIPETGVNTAVVTAYDLFNNPSLPITRIFSFTNVRPEFAGNYNGLLNATASSLSPIDHEGLVNIKVLSTGTFTGKVTLSGTVFPIAGVFLKDGSARFGKNDAPALELVKKAKPVDLVLGKLALKLDTAPGADRITGELSQGATVVALLGHAGHAFYTAKRNPIAPLMNVPVTLLDSRTDKGKYTALFLARTAPNNGVTDFPRGDGWARASVAASGMVRIIGKLADGSAVSYSNALSRENELPVFVLLYSKTGLLSGSLRFDPAQTETDASGVDFTWYKRASSADKAYPAGWPEGIYLDLAASKFVKMKPVSGLNALNIPGVAAPAVNAVVTLADGLLPNPVSNDISVALNNKSTVIGTTSGFAGVEGLKLTIAGATGAVSGSFTHPGNEKAVSFSGIVYQKTHAASGYFLYSPPNPAGPAAPSNASGRMQVLTAP